MRRGVTVCFGCAFVWMGAAHAQYGRGGGDWTTSGGDAQRSSWVRADAKISKQTLEKPGFALVWKIKVSNDPKQLNALTTAILLERYIGYRGFRSYAFAGGSSDNVFAFDTDLGRVEWQKHLPSAAPQPGGSLTCPGGLTANLARPMSFAFPGDAPAGRGGGGGRGAAAKSGVGEPGQGAVILAEMAARGGDARGPGGAGRAGGGGRNAAAGGNRGAAPAYDIYASRVSWLHALSSDGMFHSMYVSNGDEPQPAIPFLPANANAQGLIVADGAAYTVTTAGCGGVPDGVWALDLASKAVATWKPSSGGIVGSAGAAIGPDGTLYVATDAGEIAALEPKTLKLKDVYSGGKPGFSSSPVIFQYKDKTLLAAAARDGRIHLLDTAAMPTALSKTPVYSEAADFAAGALSSWQDMAGTRWILAPAAAPVANASVANGAIVAWKVTDQSGAPSLQPGWVSRDMVSPLPPMIVNGVVFAVSSGEFRAGDARITAAERAQRSSPAILYALDPGTGKELWSSGKTMTSFVHGGGLSAGGSQLYLGTHDGTLYAFGFPIEH